MKKRKRVKDKVKKKKCVKKLKIYKLKKNLKKSVKN